jgi:hypothetical protein
MYMEPYLKGFITGSEPAFEIPSNRTFAASILDICYEETKTKVLDALQRARILHISVDESSNIRQDRIINTSTSDETDDRERIGGLGPLGAALKRRRLE